MDINRILRLVAGFFIMLSVALSHFHHQYWLFFTAFVGLNLFQSAFTKWCPLVTILQKIGVKECSCNISEQKEHSEKGNKTN